MAKTPTNPKITKLSFTKISTRRQIYTYIFTANLAPKIPLRIFTGLNKNKEINYEIQTY